MFRRRPPGAVDVVRGPSRIDMDIDEATVYGGAHARRAAGGHEVGDAFAESRLRQAEGPEGADPRDAVGSGGAEARQDDLGQHEGHFTRDARHAEELSLVQPAADAAGGADGVRQCLAAARHEGLAPVGLADRPAAGLGPGLQVRQGRRVDLEGGTHRRGQALARAVVERGPQTAGGNDEVGFAPDPPEGGGNGGGIIVHGLVPDDFQAQRGQCPRDVGRVGVEPQAQRRVPCRCSE